MSGGFSSPTTHQGAAARPLDRWLQPSYHESNIQAQKLYIRLVVFFWPRGGDPEPHQDTGIE